MKQVWMCREDVTEQVPMDAREIARRHWDGWRQCAEPNVKKSEDQTEPMAPTAPESPDIAAPAD
jgi:hypothetical protein